MALSQNARAVKKQVATVSVQIRQSFDSDTAPVHECEAISPKAVGINENLSRQNFVADFEALQYIDETKKFSGLNVKSSPASKSPAQEANILQDATSFDSPLLPSISGHDRDVIVSFLLQSAQLHA